MKARLSLTLCLTVSLLHASMNAQQFVATQHAAPPADPSTWTSSHVTHVLGMPDVKAKANGTLAITASHITFTSKSAQSTLDLPNIVALSAGQERVELWGTKGRILRMVVPDGGGIALASVMHHRRDSLTVDFLDAQHRSHSAVFFLPGQEAEQALHHIAIPPTIPQTVVAEAQLPAPCTPTQLQSNSILVKNTHVPQSEFPAAYRALLYEHIVDRLRRVPGTEVHRDGGPDAAIDCSHYTMRLTTTAYKPGNQVKRAALGPIGMFVGSTQIKVDIDITGPMGATIIHEEAKATQRGEAESINVVDSLAKQVVKKWINLEKSEQKQALLAKR